MPLFNSALGIGFADSDPIPEKVCQWRDCADETQRKMKACAKCKSVRYCSKACQKSDWPEHKLYCDLPPLVDIGQWMAKYYDLFHWALIEGLKLRTNPSNLLQFAIWVDVKRMDRMINGGLSPSPFSITSLAVMSLDDIAKYAGNAPRPSESRNADIQAQGGIGEAFVVFCFRTGKSNIVHIQYHAITEIPQGTDSPSDVGWKNIVKGVVNGDIGISSLSRMIEPLGGK